MQNSGSFDILQSVYRIHHLRVVVNGLIFKEVAIDSHFEEKHKDHINDKIILELVKKLNYKTFLPEAISESGTQYFVNEPWYLEDKPYRLVWFIPSDESYLGVRNAFRRRHGK